MSDIPTHILIKSAKAWMPEPGAIVAGHVITIQRRTTEFGAYPCVILQEDDKDGNERLWAIHAFHKVLQEELKRIKPTPGSYLEVAYLGKQASRKRKDSDGKPVNTNVYSASDGSAVELTGWDQTFGSEDEPDF